VASEYAAATAATWSSKAALEAIRRKLAAGGRLSDSDLPSTSTASPLGTRLPPAPPGALPRPCGRLGGDARGLGSTALSGSGLHAVGPPRAHGLKPWTGSLRQRRR